MSANLYNSFVKATRDVFKLMLDLSDIEDNPADDFVCDDSLDISIGVTGDLEGEVIYRFPPSTSLSMVNIMVGMDLDSVDEFVTSAISEIANIISGNVLTMLSDNKLKCDILPPKQGSSDEGKEYDIHQTSCLTTSVGGVCLDIKLNQAN
ncbi:MULTISPECIES: chemotaxis protein CheX [unclassified Sedimentibacter]|uniref:chemotaxis protein CheX n=1 Tax=unclassified Sedimentibacter TaxID=2649220 RepID=UPI0027DED847|nr:chemotaxis protein CheX [Sedimentibacter sp. MB35-C1]WMJ76842.1 chemotaxis protein CheX [Sedimentibacter sp. MB35-C1]